MKLGAAVHPASFLFVFRHPLQELCCNPFVPNDICSGSDFGNITIINGPNASGKSVYIKQVRPLDYVAMYSNLLMFG